MAMNTTLIIHHCEKLYTLTKRAGVSQDRDTVRDKIDARFSRLVTDLGKIASACSTPDWMKVHEKVVFLHTAAVEAEERRLGPWAHLGAETALVTSLHALAAVMGFTLADAATAAEDAANDDAAMAAVEGLHPQAAE